MKVFLDNIPLSYTTAELLKPKFTLRKKDETGESAFSFTGDLVFYGADYDYLFARLVTDANAITNQVELKFVDDCCNQKEFKFWIRAETLKWCENTCNLTAAAVEATDAQAQLNCLKNTMIYDDWNVNDPFTQRQHPRMAYCNELRPDWLHDVLIILTIATWTSFLTIGPILIVIATMIVIINFIIGINNTIIGVLNTLPGVSINTVNPIDIDGDASTNAYAEFDNWVRKLLANSFGCGRKHPSPLVREYAKNVCGKCGLTFQSSILNNPSGTYYNLVYHNAPIDKGLDPTDTSTYWIDKNKPLLNGTSFFNKIKQPFNADWRIQNNKLVFERRDYFVPTAPWLDLTTLPSSRLAKPVCWNWTNKPRYSYGNFYYQKDAVNWVGGEASDRWGDIVEWNNPYSPLQKDEFKPLIEFSPCRFRNDGIDRDVLSTYDDLPTIHGLIAPYNNAILLNSHTCYLPMLLLWDGDSVDNAKVNGANAFFAGLAGPNEFYNYHMWIKEGYPNNLYDNFWYIENPRHVNWKGKDYEAQVFFECEDIMNMDLDGMVMTSEGPGKIDSIELDYNAGIMLIKGTV